MAKAKKRTAKRAIPSMRLGGHKTLVLKNPIARIVVVGVGGAGGNIVSRMMEGDRMRGSSTVMFAT
jgi:cell division GTPase FtsZ